MSDDFFSRCKHCAICGRPLPNDYRFDICAACEDMELFDQVRDYIRKNDVNEIEVAEHFHISRRKIHAWIREGRIEYKSDPDKMCPLTCKSCGKSIPFGEYCPDCLRKGGGQIHFKGTTANKHSSGAMHFDFRE